MAGLAKLRCGILPFVEGPLWAGRAERVGACCTIASPLRLMLRLAQTDTKYANLTSQAPIGPFRKLAPIHHAATQLPENGACTMSGELPRTDGPLCAQTKKCRMGSVSPRCPARTRWPRVELLLRCGRGGCSVRVPEIGGRSGCDWCDPTSGQSDQGCCAIQVGVVHNQSLRMRIHQAEWTKGYPSLAPAGRRGDILA